MVNCYSGPLTFSFFIAALFSKLKVLAVHTKGCKRILLCHSSIETKCYEQERIFSYQVYTQSHIDFILSEVQPAVTRWPGNASGNAGKPI